MEEYQPQTAEEAERIEEAQQDQVEYKEDEQYLASDRDDLGLGQDLGGYGNTIGYSEQRPVGGVYALFQDVLTQPSSIKVSNLDKEELGQTGITVRDAMKIALIGNTFKHPTFADFFLKQAGITTDSAMSKKGWFTELFVTSKKFAQRDTSSSVNLPQQQQGKSKWNLFAK